MPGTSRSSRKARRRFAPALLVGGVGCLAAAALMGWDMLAPGVPQRNFAPVVHAFPTSAPVPAGPPVPPSPSPTSSPAPTSGAVPPARTPKPTPTLPVLTPYGSAKAHILMYHYVRTMDGSGDPLGYNLSVTPERLDQQLGAMRSAGYSFITMAQLMAGGGGPKDVVLTFDDGYEDFYTAALPILRKHGATATVYVITHKIGGGYMTWDQLRELKAAGIEVGAHTMDHPNLSSLSLEAQRAQISGSKQALEAELGGSVTAFCYPSGRYTADTARLVQEAGFTSATTANPGGVYSLSQPFTLNRLRVSPGLGLAELLEELRR